MPYVLGFSTVSIGYSSQLVVAPEYVCGRSVLRYISTGVILAGVSEFGISVISRICRHICYPIGYCPASFGRRYAA